MNYLSKNPVLLRNTKFVGYDFVSENELELLDYYSILDNIMSFAHKKHIFMLELSLDILLKNADVLKLFTKNSILKLRDNTFSDLKLKKLKQLKEHRYKIAFYFDNAKEYDEEFLNCVNYIIVDAFSFNLYKNRIDKLDKKVILTEVDTIKIYEQNKDFEIDFFVGNFEYIHEETVETYDRNNDKIIILNILNELETNNNVSNIANIFAKNTDLTIKLLQYLNSPAIGLRKEISSIHQAITLLGETKLMAWLGMFLYGNDTKKFNSILKLKIKNRITTISLFLEAIGDIKNTQKGVLIASLSLADTIVNKSLKDVIDSLLINDELKEAILYKKGKLGNALALSIAFESKKQDEIDEIFDDYSISETYKHNFYTIYNLPIKKVDKKKETILQILTKKLFKLF